MEQFILTDIDKIPPTPEGLADVGNGVNSFIYRGKHLQEIQDRYGRTGCCLKIFKNREIFKPSPDEKWWGHSHPLKGSILTEATHIQNIYAHEGLAPRTYALIVVKINNKRHWAQLVEDMGDDWGTQEEQDTLIKGEMQRVADEYGITIFNDGRETNTMQGKYIDFQGFHLIENYTERLKQKLNGIANVGKWGPWMNYHDIPKLGITGGRRTEHRITNLGFDKLDFKGKTVLDIGCSEGIFCHLAEKKGAKRVVGIDLPGVVKNLWELASYLGYYNVDFKGYELKTEIPDLGQFDMVLYLSMCQHIGFPDWVHNITKELLVFEGNGKSEDAPAFARILQQFKKVEAKGKTTDLLERPVVWAYR